MALNQQEKERFLQALDTDPQFLAEVRNRLLSPELAQLPERFAELVQVVAQLSANFEAFAAETNRRLTNLETDVADLKTGQARLEGNMNRLIGSNYERKAARRASRLIQRSLGMNPMTVIYAITKPDDNRLPELLDRAMAEGKITADEADELEEADIILANDTRYTVAEVSIVLDEDDVKRARARADLLAKATAAPVTAAVIGTYALDSAAHFAADHDVALMSLSE